MSPEIRNITSFLIKEKKRVNVLEISSYHSTGGFSFVLGLFLLK